MDANILVTAPYELRIQRVIDRDHVLREDVIIRMQNQFPEEESLKMADFVIRNDGSEFIIKQVLEIDKRLKEDGKFW
jgi:dephospho-CoA kinase